MKFMDGFKPSLYIDLKRLGVFISFVFVGEKSNSFIFYFFVSLKMLLKKKKKIFITILLIYFFFFLKDEAESGLNWVQN